MTTHENVWKPMKTHEHIWKLMKGKSRCSLSRLVGYYCNSSCDSYKLCHAPVVIVINWLCYTLSCSFWFIYCLLFCQGNRFLLFLEYRAVPCTIMVKSISRSIGNSPISLRSIFPSQPMLPSFSSSVALRIYCILLLPYNCSKVKGILDTIWRLYHKNFICGLFGDL